MGRGLLGQLCKKSLVPRARSWVEVACVENTWVEVSQGCRDHTNCTVGSRIKSEIAPVDLFILQDLVGAWGLGLQCAPVGCNIVRRPPAPFPRAPPPRAATWKPKVKARPQRATSRARPLSRARPPSRSTPCGPGAWDSEVRLLDSQHRGRAPFPRAPSALPCHWKSQAPGPRSQGLQIPCLKPKPDAPGPKSQTLSPRSQVPGPGSRAAGRKPQIP